MNGILSLVTCHLVSASCLADADQQADQRRDTRSLGQGPEKRPSATSGIVFKSKGKPRPMALDVTLTSEPLCSWYLIPPSVPLSLTMSWENQMTHK